MAPSNQPVAAAVAPPPSTAAPAGLDCRNFDLAQYKQQAAAAVMARYTTWLCCQFAPDEPSLLVAGNSHGDIRLYSVPALASGNAAGAATLSMQAHRGPVYQLAFASLGGAAVLLTAGDDGCVRGWEWAALRGGSAPAAPQFELAVPKGLSAEAVVAEVNAVYAPPGGQHVYAGAGDGVCYCWDVSTGQAVAQLRGHKAGILSATGHASHLATASADSTVRLWDLRNSQCSATISPPNPSKTSAPPPVKAVQFDSGGNWLVATAGAGLHMWSVCAAAMASTIRTEAPLQAIVTQPNRILTAGDEACVRKYDFSGACLGKMTASSGCAYGLAASETTRVVATCGARGMLDVFTENGSRLGGLLP